jgi:riboflavin-specific deaminase-like protein
MNLNQKIERWLTTRKNNFTSDNRPFVTLAFAQSLDGSISTQQGESLSLSGTKSIQLTHQLRSLHEGILVGIETVLTDDPQLTARHWNGPNPQPIVLDSLLRMPESARLCHHPDKKCWILTVSPESAEKENNLEILRFKNADEKRVPLDIAMNLIRQKGIASLMVEGGGTVITAFLKARIVDAIVITIAPKIICGYKAVNNLGSTNLTQFPHIDLLNSEKLDNDLIIWGDMNFGEITS